MQNSLIICLASSHTYLVHRTSTLSTFFCRKRALSPLQEKNPCQTYGRSNFPLLQQSRYILLCLLIMLFQNWSSWQCCSSFFVLCTNDGGSVAADGIHEVGQVEAAVHGLKKQTSQVSKKIYLCLSPVLLWPQRPLRRPWPRTDQSGIGGRTGTWLLLRGEREIETK